MEYRLWNAAHNDTLLRPFNYRISGYILCVKSPVPVLYCIDHSRLYATMLLFLHTYDITYTAV